MDKCRKAFEQLYDDSESDWEIFKNGWLAGMAARTEWMALTARTEAKVSGEVVTREAIAGLKEALSLVEKYNTVTDRMGDIATLNSELTRAESLISQAIHALQLPAPQSPVVPGVGALQDIIEPVIEQYVEHHSAQYVDCPVCVGSLEAAEAIHAHLLANARESREGVVKALEMAKVYIEWERDCKLNVGRHVGREVGILTAIKEALATVGKEW